MDIVQGWLAGSVDNVATNRGSLIVRRSSRGIGSCQAAIRAIAGTTGRRGKQAIADFKAFVDAGVTTFDTADIYGPSESLIGDYINSRGGAEGLQLLTKACKFGSDMQNVSQDSISAVRPLMLLHVSDAPRAYACRL